MVNRQNYLWIKNHLRFLEEVHLIAPASLRRYWFYLRHLLIWARETLFPEAATIRPTYPAHVASLTNGDGSTLLAPGTQKKVVQTARRFFRWARTSQHKEFRHLPIHWIETLRPVRQPQSAGDHNYVSLEEALQLAAIPVDPDNLALCRDKAAAAMLFLSGARASAFTTLPIEAVKIKERTLHQWPELGVKTKNGKRSSTFLLPIPELLTIVNDWDTFIRTRLSPSTLWFVPMESRWGEQRISSAEPGRYRNLALNKRLRLLFKFAGLPYKSAHKFRHGHAVYGLQHAQTMADYKAVSMNLMHANIQVTDGIYAPLLDREVKKRIGSLNRQSVGQPSDHLEKYFNKLSDPDIWKALLVIAGRLAQ